MEFPKMLYKGVKPNAFGQLEAEQTTIVQDADEEAQARKAGWHSFDEQPKKPAPEQTPQAPEAKSQAAEGGEPAAMTAADKPAAQPKPAKATKAAAADKPVED